MCPRTSALWSNGEFPKQVVAGDVEIHTRVHHPSDNFGKVRRSQHSGGTSLDYPFV